MWIFLRRSAAFWFGLVLLVSGLGMIPVVLQEKRTYDAFLRESRLTEAPVLERLQRTDPDGDTVYILEFQYYDEALNQYPRTLSVDRLTWESYRPGNLLPVRYLVSDPEKIVLESDMRAPSWKETRRVAIIFSVVGSTVVLLAGLEAARMMRRRSLG